MSSRLMPRLHPSGGAGSRAQPWTRAEGPRARRGNVIELFGTLNPWLLYVLTLIIVLGGTWLGRRLGARARRRDPANADHLPAAQSVLIGLLSLMIGFTLNVSLGRWQARQTAVLHETTAIETSLDRATLLPGEDAGQARAQLIQYLHTRILIGEAGSRPRLRREEGEQSVAIKERLWEEARHATAHGMQALAVSSFVTSLDGLGDAQQERLAADYTEVPGVVVATLYGLATVAFAYLGFVAGAKDARNDVSNAVLAAAFVTVITIVADLDRPDAGITAVSQRSLVELERSLHPAPPVAEVALAGGAGGRAVQA